MKKKFVAGRLVSLRILASVIIFFSIVTFSCDPESNQLGINIFPPGDTIIVYTDTITNLDTKLVTSWPRVTSLTTATASSDRVFLLGSRVDTITGTSKADIATQFSITTTGLFGDNPHIDSVMLWLYVNDVEGDTTQEMHLLVYELTDTISYYETYYSDYDISGMYDPVPLVDEVIIPRPDSTYGFAITRQDFIDRILAAASDTIFNKNSLVQEYFKGLYITTEQVSGGGAFAKVQLASESSRLGFRYLHDSVLIDTADESDYSWYYMYFNEYYSQKINMFHHDFAGTTVGQMIDQPDVDPKIMVAQGMSGVNVSITIPDLANYLDSGMISINSAKLIMYVVPDSISGIKEEDYPARLMLFNRFPDGEKQVVYDYLTNSSATYFGKLQRSNEVSAFMDPVYYYSFNLGRHLQAVLNGEIENPELVLYVDDPETTAKFIKLWSNYSGSDKGLKLELIYTRF